VLSAEILLTNCVKTHDPNSGKASELLRSYKRKIFRPSSKYERPLVLLNKYSLLIFCCSLEVVAPDLTFIRIFKITQGTISRNGC
jgi:hypothetical protein